MDGGTLGERGQKVKREAVSLQHANAPEVPTRAKQQQDEPGLAAERDRFGSWKKSVLGKPHRKKRRGLEAAEAEESTLFSKEWSGA